MKLDKFELDKKLSIVDMKQVKAGSNPSCTGGKYAVSDSFRDSDINGNPYDPDSPFGF
jgi:hypothetical protein